MTLRVALAGPGSIGRTHAAAIAAVPGLSLAAVAGGSAEARAAFGPVGSYADTEAMLHAVQPDIVVVATPGGRHFAPAAAALRHGCHVLVEKPLCADPAEAAALVALARDSNRVCATVSQRRLEPVHQHLAAALRAGTLGRPRLVAAELCWWRPDSYYAERPWRAEAGEGGGSLVNQGIHSLDLLLWLFGPVLSVSAHCATLGHALPVEDMTAAVLAFASGAMGTVVTSTATPPGHPAILRVFTDAGSLELSQDRVVRWNLPGPPPPGPAAPSATGAADPLAIGTAGMVAQWQDMLAAVTRGTPPAATFADGRAAVRLADAIYRAAAERRTVAVRRAPADDLR